MSDQQTQDAACMEMGALAEAHKRFEPFVSKFKAEVKMWMGPGDAMISTGMMTNTLELGSRYLNQCYKGDSSDGPFPNFEGRGYWGYNTTIEKYEGFWIDSASTIMQHDAGDVDASGKVWTMLGEMMCPQTKDPMKKRSVITLKDNDHHSTEMFFTGPDGKENKAMEIQYERAS